MSYPATILPAGEGRRGDLLPAPSPEISAAHTPVKRKLTVVVPPARVCSLARANSPGAPASGVLSRSPAGASGRNSHQPVSCGGTGCASPSAAMCTHSTRAGRDSRLVRNGGSDEEAQTGQAAWPLHLFFSLDQRRRRRDLTRVDQASLSPVIGALRHAPCAMQGDETPLRLSPFSGGCTHADGLFRRRYQCWRRGAECSYPSADTLNPSALTADPRRADPGNLLAGAVFVLRRSSIMCNWPVALRGGGHIAGVV